MKDQDLIAMVRSIESESPTGREVIEMALNLEELRKDLQQGEEVKVTPEGRIVESNSPAEGTQLKPNTWAR